MKTGRNLEDLLREVIRQKDVKKDYVADTRLVTMTDDARLKFGDVGVGIKALAHDQIAGHSQIPKKYYDKMLVEAPDLLAKNVNEWFAKYPAPRMIRTLDGEMRAFLSDRYRPLDNADLLEAALPPLMKMGVEVLSCEVTESRLYLKVVDKRILKDLPTGWSPTNRGHQRFDTVSPALVLSNSEVGAGALSCQTSVFTGGCSNLAVIRERSARKYHVGGKHELGDDVYKMLSESTRKLTDAALWAQIADVVKGAFDQAQFDATCKVLEAATQDVISKESDPIKVVEVTAKKFGLSDSEKNSVLKHFLATGDWSKYGLHGAVTRAAEDVQEYDRASQLEQLGGVIVELPKSEWREIAKAAIAETAEAA